jgi:hypothetical protein
MTDRIPITHSVAGGLVADYVALTVPEAAAQLRDLINSQARSPRQDEIEAILERMSTHIAVSGGVQVQCSRCLEPRTALSDEIRALIPLVQQARNAVIEADTAAVEEGRERASCPNLQAAEALAERLDSKLKELAMEAWRRSMSAPSLDLLSVLAEYAQHHACDWPTSPSGLMEEGPYGLLVMAVLHYTASPFSVDGEPWPTDDEEEADPASSST